MFGLTGRERFERCLNKRVETNANNYNAATVDCAATGEEGFDIYNSTLRSLPVYVAKSMGKAMCRGCRFVDMTREQVSAARTQQAVAEGIRLEAEYRLELLQQQIDEGTHEPRPLPPAAE